MSRNRGNTSLRSKRHPTNPMRDYDLLPAELRNWLSSAMLPWGAKSAKQAYEKAIRRTGNKAEALKELDALQQRLLMKDAPKVWGDHYPV
ncbi:MAG: DUF6525 family protein [Pseudomonadota bacterium]|nr:DUF6525 family protein [Pseudomonadota bacterium]